MPTSNLRHTRRALAALAMVAALTSCGHNDFEDRTALVTLGGSTTTYELDSCGLDGRTAFVVGRSGSGEVLQAVVGVEADRETGVTASTGISVIDGDVELAGFGAESWERRGMDGSPPGSLSSARIRGSRIQAAGRLVAVDRAGRQSTPGSDRGTAFTLDARCDEVEG